MNANVYDAIEQWWNGAGDVPDPRTIAELASNEMALRRNARTAWRLAREGRGETEEERASATAVATEALRWTNTSRDQRWIAQVAIATARWMDDPWTINGLGLAMKRWISGETVAVETVRELAREVRKATARHETIHTGWSQAMACAVLGDAENAVSQLAMVLEESIVNGMDNRERLASVMMAARAGSPEQQTGSRLAARIESWLDDRGLRGEGCREHIDTVRTDLARELAKENRHEAMGMIERIGDVELRVGLRTALLRTLLNEPWEQHWTLVSRELDRLALDTHRCIAARGSMLESLAELETRVQGEPRRALSMLHPGSAGHEELVLEVAKGWVAEAVRQGIPIAGVATWMEHISKTHSPSAKALGLAAAIAGKAAGGGEGARSVLEATLQVSDRSRRKGSPSRIWICAYAGSDREAGGERNLWGEAFRMTLDGLGRTSVREHDQRNLLQWIGYARNHDLERLVETWNEMAPHAKDAPGMVVVEEEVHRAAKGGYESDAERQAAMDRITARAPTSDGLMEYVQIIRKNPRRNGGVMFASPG